MMEKVMASVGWLSVSIVLLTFTGLIGTGFYYRFLDTDPPIKFVNEQSFGLDAQERIQKARPGEMLYAHREFYQLLSVRGMVSQRFICGDEVVKVIPDFPENFPASPNLYVKNFPFEVPKTFPRKCFYDVSIAYRLNSLSPPVSIQLAPVFFEVLP